MAGAKLFATVSSEQELAAAFEQMVQRLLQALGLPVVPGEPLLWLRARRSAKTWSGRTR